MPTSARTPYEVLGVSSTATQAEITKAYRTRALHSHPDRAGGDTDEFKAVAQAYETLRDPATRREYDRGGVAAAASASPPPRTARTGRDPFDDAHFGHASFSTSFGANAHAHGQDPFSLFDRMFAEFSGVGPRASSSSSSSSMASHHPAWDPFGTGFGTFGIDRSDDFGFGGGFGAPRRGTFLDSFFGSGAGSFNGIGGGGGEHYQQQQMRAPAQAPPSHSSSSSSSSRGVQSRQNPRSGYTNCSFSTSFGTSTSTSSSTSMSSSSSSSSMSTSRSTRIVDGVRQDITRHIDARGNSTTHIRASDGTERVWVNGVEQSSHPLLARAGGGNGGNGPQSQQAITSSSTSTSSSSSSSSARSGDGSRKKPYEVY